MLKLVTPMVVLLVLIWQTPPKWLWTHMFGHTSMLAILSLTYLPVPVLTDWSNVGPSMALDRLSAPLLVLTLWVLPLMILASQDYISKEPTQNQRTYLFLLISINLFLVVAFSATDMLLFYVMFESSLVPTLFIVTRWGLQQFRMRAGNYLLFYTLAGSLPLLVAVLVQEDIVQPTTIMTLPYQPTFEHLPTSTKLWVAACWFAFFVKTPLYGMHLWLTKAHVEAPVAGSMILAAVLLKLGGYGAVRMITLAGVVPGQMIPPLISMCLWGLVMTTAVCLRNPDLKAAIAYASISHMALVTMGIFTQSAWGLSGAFTLMIAHGLTSSALFCLVNSNYERMLSRNILVARGIRAALPLVHAWWFLAFMANLGLPPLPNFIGELLIIVSTIQWCKWTIACLGVGLVFTAAYSLYVMQVVENGPLPREVVSLPPTHSREHLLFTLHLLPILLLVAYSVLTCI